VVELGTQVTI